MHGHEIVIGILILDSEMPAAGWQLVPTAGGRMQFLEINRK